MYIGPSPVTFKEVNIASDIWIIYAPQFSCKLYWMLVRFYVALKGITFMLDSFFLERYKYAKEKVSITIEDYVLRT